MLRKILSVGGWTLVSRATGFLRDVVMAAVMGAGPITDAFVVAFRLPNHFRAIFGEGAFNAAFIPTYGRLREVAGEGVAQLFASRIFTLMLLVQIVLLGLVLLAMPAFVTLLAPGLSGHPATFDLAVTLTRITFPYLLLITLVTLISAVLNAHDRFWAAAAAPILLNVSMIATLLAAWLFPSAGHAAAWGVTISGALQLALVWWDARRAGIAPRATKTIRDPELGGFFRRLGPAVLGSAGVQVALFADTIIGSLLPAGALSALYYAERLYQLPLGVVGIAAGTVVLPEMSRRIAAGDVAGAHASQNRAIGLTFALAAPCAVAFVLIPDLIMSALFQRGAFDAGAAARSAGVLAAYSAALPAAVLVRSVVASFYARQDTKTPLYASLAGYGINVALKLALTPSLGVVGLALGTAAGVWVNVGLLYWLASRRGWTDPAPPLRRSLAVVVLGCGVLAAFLWFGANPIGIALAGLGRFAPIATLTALAAIGAGLYGVLLLAGFKLAGIRLRRA
jgi:putative peptidoglycan lipid II flippase